MHRGIFKRAGCVLLIAVMCFGLAAPAFASSSSWYDDFLDGLLVPSISVPSGISTAVSDIAFFSALKTSLNGTSQLLLRVQGDTSPDELPSLVKTGYQNFLDNSFTSNYSTTSTDRYVYVTLTDLQEFVRELSYLPIVLTYFPSTGVYVPVLSSSAIISARTGGISNATKTKMWQSFGASVGGTDFVEGQALKAIPYLGDYILVAPAPDREPDFFPSEDKTSSSATTNHNYYTDSSSVDNSVNDNSVTTNTTIYEGGETYNTSTFDYSNGTWYDNVSGTVNDIENLYYNPSTNTYTINNTYNITYEYNYTYYYNLGSSENLVQDYKFYYELPDGRSSSDLTADEIAGLSLEFDVVNYAQDRTDENTKILVPFDGSWENTAYQGVDLKWITGASVTYKESASFNGALYLPGDTRSTFYFPFAVPSSSLFSQGMTVQFRYYCDALSGSSASFANFAFTPFEFTSSGRPSPLFYFYRDKIIFSPNTSLADFSLGQGTAYGSLSAGVWNDITLSIVPMSSTSLRYILFVNGVSVLSVTQNAPSGFSLNSNGLSPEFYFNFSDFSDHLYSTGSPSGLPYQMIDNLRVVDFALYDSSVSFVPTPVPFDTNLVYVLPDTTNLKDNTIAVQSGVPVSGYRIGGVRPTFPDEGMVWMPLENDKIADCQIYNGSYWESVGCRVWTGERWVPAWAFNVITLSDLWDMYGGEDSDNYTEITPGSFYQWFQQQFLELKTTIANGFDRILQALGVQTDDTDVTEPDAEGNSNFTFFQFFDNLFSIQQKEESGVVSDALDDLLDLTKRFLRSIRDFFAGFAVMEGLGSDYLQAASDALSGVSELVSGVWLAIPSAIQDVLVACFMLVVFGVLVAIFV